MTAETALRSIPPSKPIGILERRRQAMLLRQQEAAAQKKTNQQKESKEEQEACELVRRLTFLADQELKDIPKARPISARARIFEKHVTEGPAGDDPEAEQTLLALFQRLNTPPHVSPRIFCFGVFVQC